MIFCIGIKSYIFIIFFGQKLLNEYLRQHIGIGCTYILNPFLVYSLASFSCLLANHNTL